MATYLVKFYPEVSISRACKVTSFPKSMYYYRTVRDDSATINKLIIFDISDICLKVNNLLQKHTPWKDIFPHSEIHLDTDIN